MSGSGSHCLVPVLKVVKFLHQITHVKPEQQQIRTWVIDLSRSQLAIAIMTSKSHQQLLGSIRKSSFLLWPISRLCNTRTGSPIAALGQHEVHLCPPLPMAGQVERKRLSGVDGQARVKLSQTFFSPLVICLNSRRCIDGEGLVVDHLHPVEGHGQMQLDVAKGLEPGVTQAVEHLLAVIKCHPEPKVPRYLCQSL